MKTDFEKWLGRAKLFVHTLRQDHPLSHNHIPILNYKNDLRKAYQAGERNERRKEWIKVDGRFLRRALWCIKCRKNGNKHTRSAHWRKIHEANKTRS